MSASAQVVALPQTPATTPAAAPGTGSYSLPLAYLRGFLTLIVVSHHASLAYYPWRPPVALSLNHPPYWWAPFPVVDKVQWGGFLFTVLFNDIYSMPLFFLVSGLFAWKSLQRHGIPYFLRERLMRLLLPFAVITLLMPISYYPAYLQSRTHDGFFHEWLSLGVWPCGPVWFISVLFAFDLLLTGVFRFAPSIMEGFSRQLARITNPLSMAALLLGLSCAAYLPMALNFDHYELFSWGPFFVHKTRVLLYVLYFVIGVALGIPGLQHGMLRNQGRLADQWLGWLVAAPSCFFLMLGIRFLSHRIWNPPLWEIVLDIGFCLSCVASSLAALACCLHFVRKASTLLTSLAACAYGIYLVHSFFVAWLQYGLLSISAPGWLKGLVVFGIVLPLSWSLIHSLRKIPLIARII